MTTTSICHIVAMPANVGEAAESYFQGFSMALFPDYLTILSALIDFPHDILDSYLTSDKFILAKTMGPGLEICMLRVDLIDEAHLNMDRHLNVIWSSAASAELVEKALDKFSVRPIHITTGITQGITPISGINTKTPAKKCCVTSFSGHPQFDKDFEPIFGLIQDLPLQVRAQGKPPFTPSHHNCTRALLQVLRTYGYDISHGESIKPSPDTEKHKQGMLDACREIDRLRNESGALNFLRKNDAIIFCPSSFTYLYRANSRHWNELYRKLTKDQRNFLKNALIRNRGYGNTAFAVDSPTLSNPYKDKVIGPLLTMKQFEMNCFTINITLAAVNQFAPALRLPNSVMLHHDRLANIYHLINSDKKTEQKS